jgi:hypothetical protein
MKHYTKGDVLKWVTLNRIAYGRLPRPFPGKTPTRLYVSVAWKPMDSKKVYKWSYIGKPNFSILDKINRIRALHAYTTIYTREFDRGGLISLSRMDEISSKGTSLKSNPQLWAKYHPHVCVDYYPTWLGLEYKVVDHAYVLGGD